jgi:steroid 5-alpha reductase family enzyme
VRHDRCRIVGPPVNWGLYGLGLAAIGGLALAGWLIATARRNVAVVDSLWGLFLLAAMVVYCSAGTSVRGVLVLALVGVWAVRLSAYVTWRNRGQPEDRRYQAIRAAREPGFWWKSAYVVFGLQAVLAWIISLPLHAAAMSRGALGPLDALGAALFVSGFAFETIGDAQLARFKGDPAHRGAVMDRGLWRYTRHPNYFGECCVWWGLYAIALGAGAWWSVPGPLLVTVLLLKVSGVSLLEKDIGQRRPAYADYMARTPAFLPGRPRPPAAQR